MYVASMKSLLFLLFVAFQQEVPYKASEDYEIKLDYQFRPYREAERKTVDYNEPKRKEGPQLYLVARVTLKSLTADEVRVLVGSNLNSGLTSKKAEPNMVLKIDFGFIADVKAQETAHEYTIFLVSPEKKRVSRIHLFIDAEGTFVVNGQKRGKF